MPAANTGLFGGLTDALRSFNGAAKTAAETFSDALNTAASVRNQINDFKDAKDRAKGKDYAVPFGGVDTIGQSSTLLAAEEIKFRQQVNAIFRQTQAAVDRNRGYALAAAAGVAALLLLRRGKG